MILPLKLHDVINGFRLADRNGALPHPPNNLKYLSTGPLFVRIDFWTWEFEITKFKLVRVIVFIFNKFIAKYSCQFIVS